MHGHRGCHRAWARSGCSVLGDRPWSSWACPHQPGHPREGPLPLPPWLREAVGSETAAWDCTHCPHTLRVLSSWRPDPAAGGVVSVPTLPSLAVVSQWPCPVTVSRPPHGAERPGSGAAACWRRVTAASSLGVSRTRRRESSDCGGGKLSLRPESNIPVQREKPKIS